MLTDDEGPPCGVIVGERPIVADMWGRCCRRLGLAPMQPHDVVPGTAVAAVLVDADSAAADHPGAGPIILLIDEASAPQVIAQRAALRSVITWNDSESELEAAMRTVLAGGCHISLTAVPSVLGALSTITGASLLGRDLLTPREVDVLRALIEGATIRSTGRSLGIANKTVEAHRSAAFVKLGVRTRSQAIARLLDDPTILSRPSK